jgi:hypothetical protein
LEHIGNPEALDLGPGLDRPYQLTGRIIMASL